MSFFKWKMYKCDEEEYSVMSLWLTIVMMKLIIIKYLIKKFVGYKNLISVFLSPLLDPRLHGFHLDLTLEMEEDEEVLGLTSFFTWHKFPR